MHKFFYCFCFLESYYVVLQNECYTQEGSNIDEAYEFLRLQKSMEMVGFTADVQKRFVVHSSSVNPSSPNSVQDQSSPYNYPYTVQR